MLLRRGQKTLKQGKCVASTQKKYTSRPSPPYPANDCKGKELRGNDGQLYKSIANARGVYSWKPVAGTSTTRKITRKAEKSKSKGKAYKTHDNGGRPFVVYVNPANKSVDIYTNKNPSEEAPVFFKTMKYKQIWLGEVPRGYTRESSERGNSILLQIGANQFVHIGSEIYSFSLVAGDQPVEYYSPVGNSDVPYPYLVGKTHTYFMLDYGAIPNEWLNLYNDVYEQYYGAPADIKKKVEVPLKYTVIHPRLWQ